MGVENGVEKVEDYGMKYGNSSLGVRKRAILWQGLTGASKVDGSRIALS